MPFPPSAEWFSRLASYWLPMLWEAEASDCRAGQTSC